MSVLACVCAGGGVEAGVSVYSRKADEGLGVHCVYL